MSRIDYDQLDDFDLDNIEQDDIIQYNAVTENMEPAKLPVFGSQYEFFLERGNTTTSSTSWVTHQSETTAAKPAGKYRIMWQFTWAIEEEKDTRLEVRVRANGTDLYETNFEQADAAKDFDMRNISVAWADYDLAADGDIDLLIQMRRQDKSERVRIYDSQIQIYRIS